MTLLPSLQGFGYAKALIFGEYAVMYGAHALVMALSPQLQLQLLGTGDVAHDDLYAFSGKLKACVQIKYPNCPDFKLCADDFLDAHRKKLGIGGSAAAVVALLHAISLNYHHTFSLQDAIDTHRILQNGMGSGVDVIASAMGGLLLVSHCPDAPVITRISAQNIPHIAVLATHHQAPTCHFISAAENHSHAQDYHDIISDMSMHYAQMTESVIKCDKKTFLEQNRQLIALLNKLGKIIDRPIIPDYFYSLQKLAADYHVTLKTSGAGGGDILLAMAEDPDDINALVEKLPDGFSRIDAHIATERELFK